MLHIIKFELLKIWRRPVTRILMLISILITMMVFGVLSALGTSAYDRNGEQHQGLDAIVIQKDNMDRNSGILTEDSIQKIIKIYADSVKNMDANNQEQFYYELQNKSFYWKDIHPNYPIYTWLAFVYSEPNAEVTDLNILSEAKENSISFYNARMRKLQSVLSGINLADIRSDAEYDYWINENKKIKEPYEYGDYCGWQNILQGGFVWYFAILIICIIAAPIFTIENKTKFDSILLTTKYGRTKVVWAKITAALLIGTTVYLVNSLVSIGLTFLFWGTEGWNLPIQIYSALIPYPITFLEAVLLVLGINYLILSGMIALVLLLSAKMKSAFQVLILSGGLLVLPQIMEKSTVSSLYNHILALLPGQATAFANILQQYTAYDISGKIISLPVMICFVYVFLFICSVWGIFRVYKKKQVQ